MSKKMTLPIELVCKIAAYSGDVSFRLMSKKILHYFDEHVDIAPFVLRTYEYIFTVRNATKINLLSIGLQHILIKRLQNWIIYTDIQPYFDEEKSSKKRLACQYPQDYEYHFILHMVTLGANIQQETLLSVNYPNSPIWKKKLFPMDLYKSWGIDYLNVFKKYASYLESFSDFILLYSQFDDLLTRKKIMKCLGL